MGKPNPGEIPVAVRLHMRRRRITIARLAREAQVDRSSLSLWLSGDRDIRAKQLERILRALRVIEKVLDAIA